MENVQIDHEELKFFPPPKKNRLICSSLEANFAYYNWAKLDWRILKLGVYTL